MQKIAGDFGPGQLEPGIPVTGIVRASETITGSDAVYVNSSSMLGRARANASATMSAVGVAPYGIATGELGLVIYHGEHRSDTYDASGYLGREAYVSPDTAGGVATIPPSASGQLVQVIGTWKDRRTLIVSRGGQFQRGGAEA